ncbi:hypothetical protein [Pseudoflavitalea rhizosphaerae]|uniref:hypothetical protein n=1 Tax=Pseudoflavitalea rhizosphaerae TaxID=1884793 RepID=UPI000F8D99B5|nr:hypothetical protein [Pseudoflavitalea rhizosphaerae]
MKTYKKIISISLSVFIILCCNQAIAQLASEKPVASFYSKLAKEKLAEKQKNKTAMPALKQQLPSKKPMTRESREAVEKRRQKAKM